MIRRPRRLRATKAIRNLVRETKLQKEDLIYPLFIVDGENIKREIPSMEGVYHFSVDMLEDEIKELVELGIEHVLLLFLMTTKKIAAVVKHTTIMEHYNKV